MKNCNDHILFRYKILDANISKFVFEKEIVTNLLFLQT